jgi:hypothetical protein
MNAVLQFPVNGREDVHPVGFEGHFANSRVWSPEDDGGLVDKQCDNLPHYFLGCFFIPSALGRALVHPGLWTKRVWVWGVAIWLVSPLAKASCTASRNCFKVWFIGPL